MTETRRSAVRRWLKISLLAAVWFVDLPVRMALASTQMTDEEAGNALLGLACREFVLGDWR